MVQLELKQIAHIQMQDYVRIFSEDGRWLAYRFDNQWQLLDTISGQSTPLPIPSIRKPYDLSPNGQLMATLNKESGWMLIVANASGIRRKPVTIKAVSAWDTERIALRFTADSRRLWLTDYDTSGAAVLALLDVDTLKVIDLVPKPFDEDLDQLYDRVGIRTDWQEVWLQLIVATDTLAVREQAGDTFLGTFFYRQHHDKIILAYEDHVKVAEEYVRQTCISDDGSLYVIDDGVLFMTQLSTMETLWTGPNIPDSLLDSVYSGWNERGGITLIDNHLILDFHFETPDELLIHELLIFDAVSGIFLGRHPYPRPFRRCDLKGRTLVGFPDSQTQEAMVYQIKLA